MAHLRTEFPAEDERIRKRLEPGRFSHRYGSNVLVVYEPSRSGVAEMGRDRIRYPIAVEAGVGLAEVVVGKPCAGRQVLVPSAFLYDRDLL